MRIAIIGYGKMGQTIENLAQQRGHEIVLRATSKAPALPHHLADVDIAIEFTSPEVAASNIIACFEAQVPVVCGTTGWYNRIDEISGEAEKRNGSLLYASNFSIGVNLFNDVVRKAAQVFSRFDTYTPSIMEAHHTSKKDAPSGTALTLADIMLDEYNTLDTWSDDPAQEQKLFIESIREGDVKGIHTIDFTSEVDQISLTHEAFSRDGFALGSIKGAEWLRGKTGVYTMRDMLKSIIQ